jgi:hypothetical protein
LETLIGMTWASKGPGLPSSPPVARRGAANSADCLPPGDPRRYADVPELHLGPVTLQTFGICFALAFIGAGALAWKRSLLMVIIGGIWIAIVVQRHGGIGRPTASEPGDALQPAH